MTKNVNTKKLQELIYSKFKNYQHFIDACAMKGYKPSMGSVKSWFGNNKEATRSPSIKNLPIIAEVLGVRMEKLLTGSSVAISDDTTLYIPVLEMPAGCGSSGVFDEKFSVVKEVKVAKEFLKPSLKFKYLRIFRCIGDSMEPEYHDGDYALVDMVAGRSFVKIDGLYVFRVYNEVYVKRLLFLPRKIVAKSINEKYGEFDILGDDLENFEILGKVCGRFGSNEGLLLDNQGIG